MAWQPTNIIMVFNMHYWLMKSEPNTFSIDDLAKRPKQTEPWNGVRNYQVRNWLRDDFQVGDQAFFYHSSCDTPGIVGIVTVVKAGYPDSSAFDPASEYYDPKTDPSNPRWYCVDVCLREKFKRIIALDELRQVPKLKDMRLLQKGNRLSIVPITANEWAVILKLNNK